MPCGLSRLNDASLMQRNPADLAAGQADVQPAAAAMELTRFETARQERHVGVLRIIHAVAAIEAGVVHQHDERRFTIGLGLTAMLPPAKPAADADRGCEQGNERPLRSSP